MSASSPVSESWGRLAFAPPAKVRRIVSRSSPLPIDAALTWLPYGNGRSYGDACLNPGEGVFDCRSLDRFIAWDAQTGVLTCEAGMLLSQILRFAIPRGWFLPVTPGTKFVSIGGAIANDVHGKNHHAAGSMGHHVHSVELLRSDESRQRLQGDEDLMRATIGGVGMTGLITQATLRLKRAPGPYLMQTTRRFRSLAEFWDIDAQLKRAHEYTVAWVDCMAPARERGRGLYFAGDHVEADAPAKPKRSLRVPFVPPISLVGNLTLRAFNTIYYHRPVPTTPLRVHYEPFFYPLDRILEWNRIYGAKGMYQFQCVVPEAASKEAVLRLLQLIARRGEGSFLAVLKTLGTMPARGMLSFPRPGTTLALDFPNRGTRTRELLRELEAVTIGAGGALYAAKDALMSAESFERSYPNWRAMLPHVDPRFSSAFWRRVTAGIGSQ